MFAFNIFPLLFVCGVWCLDPCCSQSNQNRPVYSVLGHNPPAESHCSELSWKWIWCSRNMWFGWSRVCPLPKLSVWMCAIVLEWHKIKQGAVDPKGRWEAERQTEHTWFATHQRGGIGSHVCISSRMVGETGRERKLYEYQNTSCISAF